MTNHQDLKVIVLDNGQRLKVPKNIILVFLPPFSPELNPAEKMWAKFKRAFKNKLYKSLDEVSMFIQSQTQSLKMKKLEILVLLIIIFKINFVIKIKSL